MRRQDVLLKLCIFGDGGVGKTTLVNRYVTGLFQDDFKMTIGADFHVKRFEIHGIEVTLQIWDFAGERRFRSILPKYILGSSGGISMYDITRYSSLKNLNEWLEVLKDGDKRIQEQIPILLVGGKADLENKRSIESKDAFEWANLSKLSGFVECSSKTGHNVNSIFQLVTYMMLKNNGFLT